MAEEIDDRVVRLQFDSAKFEAMVGETLKTLEKLQKTLDLTNAAKGLQNLDTSQANASLNTMASSVENIESKFSAMGVAAFAVITNITNKAVDAGIRIGKSLTIDPISAGFSDYNEKLTSVQTIMNATGDSIDNVNGYFTQLDEYSDKTIFNLKDMTGAFAKFTNAGLGMEQSVPAIKGIANMTALAGQGADAAAIAMYNLSQSISNGFLTTTDYKSLNLANVATKEWKNQMIQGAIAAGTLRKTGEDMYEVIDKTTGSLKTSGNAASLFSESLSEGWASAEVLTKVLGDYGDTTTEIGKKAQAAAQNVKSFPMMMETLRASVGTGWTSTFEILLGNVTQSTELFTGMTTAVQGVLDKMANARNEMLSLWAFLGGREKLLESLKIAFQALGRIMDAFRFAFEGLIPKNSAKNLLDITDVINRMAIAFRTFVEDHLKQIIYVFGIFSTTILVVRNIITGFAKLFVELFRAIVPDRSAGNALNFFGLLGKAIVDLNSFLLKSGIPAFFAILSNTLVPVVRGIAALARGFTTFLTSLQYSAVLGPVVDFFGDIGSRISAVIDMVKRGISPITAFAQAFGSFVVGQVILNIIDRVREGLSALGDVAETVFNILFKGDYAGSFAEDSGIVDFLFKVREGFISLRNLVTSIDFGPALEALGDVFSVVKGKIMDFFNFGDSDQKMEKVSESVKKFNGQMQLISSTVKGSDLGGEGAMKFDMFDDVDFEEKGNVLQRFVERVGDYISSLAEVLSGYGEKLTSIGTELRKTLVKFFTGSEIVSSASGFETLVEIINTVLFTGILLSISTFMKNFSGLVKESRGIFEQLGKTLGRFASESKSTTLIKIGVALVFLAGALKVISDIPEDQLLSSLYAMGLGLTLMFGALAAMDKGLTGGRDLAKSATAMVALAAALRVMAEAIAVLGAMDLEELKQGMIAATIGITVLAAATRLVQGNGPGMIAAALAITGLSLALLVMAGAVKLFAAFDPKELAIGLAAAVTSLLALGFAAGKMGPGMILAGPGVLVLAGALIVMAEAVKRFGEMDLVTITTGLAAIMVLLGTVAGTLGKLPPTFFLAAAAMPIVAGALLIMADALREIGEIKGGDLAKALGTVFLMLTMIAIAVNAMKGALAGAAAMVVVAFALGLLADVLIKIGETPWQELLLGLGVMAGLFLILGAAGYFLAPSIAALGAAFLLLGAGVLLFGTGVGITVAAFTYLVNSANENAAELVGVLEYLAVEIPRIIVLFAKEVAKGADDVAASFDTIMNAVGLMIISALQTVIDVIPKFVEVVDTIISAIIDFIGNRIVDFIELGFKILGALLDGILNNIGDIAVTVVEIIAEFSRTVAREMPSIIDSGIRLLRSFLSGVDSRASEIVAAGVGVIVSFLAGLASQALELARTAADVLIAFLDGLSAAIREKAPRIRESGIELAKAILSGITGGLTDMANLSKVIDSAKEVAKKIVDGFKSVIPFSSPSPLFIQIGKWIVQGLGIGLDKEDMAENSAVATAERIVSAFSKTLGNMPNALDGMGDLNPTITPVLDLSRVAAGARGLNSMMALASLTPDVSNAQARILAASSEVDTIGTDEAEPAPTNLTFIQNNNSPKALSTNDLFRQTRSQIANAKEKLNSK